MSIAFQSPPWIFLKRDNESFSGEQLNESQVSGRDDSLLRILAHKMNFAFQYVDVLALVGNENATQPGELGLLMLQRRVSCLKALSLSSGLCSHHTGSGFSVRRHSRDLREDAGSRILVLHAPRLWGFSHPRAQASQRGFRPGLPVPERGLAAGDSHSHRRWPDSVRACCSAREASSQVTAAAFVPRHHIHPRDYARHEPAEPASDCRSLQAMAG